MTNGNGDFPYWEGDRTQPGGSAESDIRPHQLDALQSYLKQRTAAMPLQQGFMPELPVQSQKPAIAADIPTVTITSGKVRIDITITPL